MAKKEILCAFGTDIDSVAGWIGSYGGGDSPSDIQRGIFATEVGVPRLVSHFRLDPADESVPQVIFAVARRVTRLRTTAERFRPTPDRRCAAGCLP